MNLDEPTDSPKSDVLSRRVIGQSLSMMGVRSLIERVARTDASVLILGESGTGKEVVARAIHDLSQRAHKAFVPLNCGAIPAELLESELFGHEKGAFTGAISARVGRFELAHEGTLFLDEIGDMPLPMQVKLLRVLQESRFERIGSNKTQTVDVRVLAATHRNLETMIYQGNFREDLFYRLNVFPIEIQPLRERVEDVEELIIELLARMKSSGRPTVYLLPAAMDALLNYSWPGNVRELANLLERLSILFPDSPVDLADLPSRYLPETDQKASMTDERKTWLAVLKPKPKAAAAGIDLKEYLLQAELELIQKALEENNWVVARAASYLNMRRTTLVEKMRKYKLERPKDSA